MLIVAMLIVAMLSVAILSVIMLSVINVNVAAPKIGLLLRLTACWVASLNVEAKTIFFLELTP